MPALGDAGLTQPVQIAVTSGGLTSPPVVGPAATSFVTVVRPQPPVVDINGPLPGSTQKIDQYSGLPAVVAGDLSIVSSAPMLASAQIAFDPAHIPQFAYDTSGTNINAVMNQLTLTFSGVDTVEHYEQVLRSLAVNYPSFQIGYTSSLTITVTTTTTNLISAPVNVLVTSLNAVRPLVDLNGPAPGRGTQATLYRGVPDQPFFQDDSLTIVSPSATTLFNANVRGPGGVSMEVDTSGTNIHASMSGGTLVLIGEDTLERYDQVLRSLKFLSVNLAPGTYPVKFTAEGSSGSSQEAIALVSVVDPLPSQLDLDGDPDHAYFAATYRPGLGPVPIVDPVGLSIDSPWQTLTGAIIQLIGPGTLHLDTSGTNITGNPSGDSITLQGVDTVANYEKVLRTTTYENAMPWTGIIRVAFSVFDSAGRQNPIVESLITQDDTPASVVGRYVFYNDSKFDGYDPGAGAADDAAIATDKAPYFAGGGVASTAAATSYVRGINGIMIDVEHLHGPVAADDFTFKIGDTNDPGTWEIAPPPSQILVRPGDGDGGSDRIELVWTDGAIKDTWLQVTLKGNDVSGGGDTNTGLTTSDVFYFANIVGDTLVGSAPPAFFTNVADELGVRTHYGYQQPLTNIYDFNKDGLVNVADEIIARTNYFLLFRIDLPAPGAVPAAAVALVDQQPDTEAAPMTASAGAVDPSGAAVAVTLSLRSASGGGETKPMVPSQGRLAVPDANGSVVRTSDEILARARWRSVEAAVAQRDDTADVDDELIADLLAVRWPLS